MDATRGVEKVYEEQLLNKLFDLRDSVALVTGASGGIGACIAMGLARCGAKVVVCDQGPEAEMAPVVEKIKGMGAEALGIHCDVRNRQSVEQAAKRAVDHFGGLHVMVANAGVLGKLCKADQVEKQVWDEVMSVNLTGAYNCCAAAYPYMKQAGRGKIILLSSIAALRGFGAQVNCLLPGAINTPFLDQVLPTKEKVEYLLHRIPAGRLGVPEDIVGPVVFLSSHASDYVTGTDIICDGGGCQVPMLADQEPEDYQP
ncbi:hypothetical protein N2152v2_009805 [Parachlorella kessleri]